MHEIALDLTFYQITSMICHTRVIRILPLLFSETPRTQRRRVKVWASARPFSKPCLQCVCAHQDTAQGPIMLFQLLLLSLSIEQGHTHTQPIRAALSILPPILKCHIFVCLSQDQYSHPHRPRGKRELYGAHHAKL